MANMSKEDKAVRYRYRDLERRLDGTTEKLATAMKPILNAITDKVNESWFFAIPDNIVPETLIRNYADTLASACDYAEILGRAHAEKQIKAHLAKDTKQEEIQALLDRKIISIDEYNALMSYDKLKYFSMALVESATIIDTVKKKLAASIQNGETVKDFIASINELYNSMGLTKLNGYYLENVYRTNTFSAYQAGRSRDLDKRKDLIAYYKYVSFTDGRVCDLCEPLNGYTAAPDSAAWQAVKPLRHYNCRCSWEVIWKDEAMGINPTEGLPPTQAMPGLKYHLKMK